MTRQQALPYLPAMFASCMLFQTLYVLCVAMWLVFPDVSAHLLLTNIFPQFRLLDLPSFVYGLILSAIYGWFVAVVFVFFYNLGPAFARIVAGERTVSRETP